MNKYQAQNNVGITLFCSSFVLFLLPIFTAYMINSEKYISNSESIKLEATEYIGYKEKGSDESSRYNFLIKSDNIYYSLTYYKQGRLDYMLHIDTHDLSNADTLFIELNPTELKKHAGTVNDPIPIFNLAFDEGKEVWKEKRHNDNIKKHIAYDDIWHTDSYRSIIYLALVLSFFLLLPGAFNHLRHKHKK